MFVVPQLKSSYNLYFIFSWVLHTKKTIKPNNRIT